MPQYSYDGTILHESTGYDLATWNDSTSEWDSDGDTVAARSWTFTPAAEEYKRITWNWHDAGYQVDLFGMLPGCSVTTGNCELVEGYVKAGSTLTLTANGENFSRWTGVPDGVDATQRTVSFAVTEPLVLSAYYANDWQYDEATKKISDGYWTIRVSATNSTLKLEWFSATPGFAGILDLDKPVSNGMKIVGIAESTSLFKKRGSGFASLINLPRTLQSVDAWAFEQCYNPITIPEKNDLVTLYTAAFTTSFLTGRVYLPKIVSLLGYDGAGPFNNCDRLTELDIGPNCSASGSNGNLAKFCDNITNLVCRAETFTIHGYDLQNSSMLQTFTFNGYPQLESNWSSGISFGKGTRMFINKSNASWSTLFESASYTPWENVSDKSTYFANFGDDAQIPLGYTTQPFKAWVLKSSIFGSGFSLIVQ